MAKQRQSSSRQVFALLPHPASNKTDSKKGREEISWNYEKIEYF
jgi:hypothetical protein